MNPELKALVDEINRTWVEMKATLQARDNEVKTHGQALGDTTGKLTALEARLADLEVKLQRPAAGKETKGKVAPESRAALVRYARKGAESLTPDERKMLTASDDTTGGFQIDEDLVAEIIKGVMEVSPFRSVARVRTTSQRSVKIRKRTGTSPAVWVGAERKTRTETGGPKYGMLEVPNHEIYALCDISNQDLEDEAFDLEGELKGEFSDQFALAEATSFLAGDGVGQPEGFLSNSSVSIDKSGDANTVKFDGLNTFLHNLKEAYVPGAVILLNRKTLGIIRGMTDSNGQPLWAPMAADAPATILGARYIQMPGMDDVAAGKFPIAYGDFKRGYLVVDRLQISLLRDALTQATEGAVRFFARKRVGGQVILPEAIRVLKVAA